MAVDQSHITEFADVLRRMSVMFARMTSEQSSGHDTFSKQELAVIDMLGIRGSSRMGEIAEHLGVVQSAVTQLADRLESNGLVERVRHEHDRRVWLVALTKKGDKLYHEFDAFHYTVAERMLAPLMPEERDALISMLSRIEASVSGH